MKTVADTSRVSRFNLAGRLQGKPKVRDLYRKAADADLLPVIRRLVGAPPTYGYRRIDAFLNRERRAADQAPVNAKRVHRIMANHAMPLGKHTAVRKGRVYDGKVMSCARTCAGARMAWRSPAGTARPSGSPSS